MWLVTSGGMGSAPAWFFMLEEAGAIAEYLRCSVADVLSGPPELRERARIVLRAKASAEKQRKGSAWGA